MQSTVKKIPTRLLVTNPLNEITNKYPIMIGAEMPPAVTAPTVVTNQIIVNRRLPAADSLDFWMSHRMVRHKGALTNPILNALTNSTGDAKKAMIINIVPRTTIALALRKTNRAVALSLGLL
jgi:hypothetical protein